MNGAEKVFKKAAFVRVVLVLDFLTPYDLMCFCRYIMNGMEQDSLQTKVRLKVYKIVCCDLVMEEDG